jgi:predicted metalloprotease with PDZ domain
VLERHRAGEPVTVHAFRRDELIVTELTLEEAPRDTCWLTLAAKAVPEVRARRDAWLGIAKA